MINGDAQNNYNKNKHNFRFSTKWDWKKLPFYSTKDELPGHMYWKCIRLACAGEHMEDNPGDVKSRLVYHCLLFHNFRKVTTLRHPNFLIKFESLMKWKNFKNISILEMHSYFKSFNKHQQLILNKIQNTYNRIMGEGIINKKQGVKTIFSHSTHFR